MAKRYDKTVWTKDRANSYEHISGLTAVRPAYDKVGSGKVSKYLIFLFASNGMMREIKNIVDGTDSLTETMEKAIKMIQ